MRVQRDCNAYGKEGFSSRLVSEEAFVIIKEETGSSRGKERLLSVKSVHTPKNYTIAIEDSYARFIFQQTIEWLGRGELLNRIFSGMMLTLLLTIMLPSAFNIQPVKAAGGTIYIRADGNIDPLTAPIRRDGDIYTFTDNINDSIVIERDNIIVDGVGYTVQGMGEGTGIDLWERRNVTIKNIRILEFYCGIGMFNCIDCTITGNVIANPITAGTTSPRGISLLGSFNVISGNSIIDHYSGIELHHFGSNNTISGNSIRNSFLGVELSGSCNMVYENSITANSGCGIRVFGSNNTISKNNVTNNDYGIHIYSSNCRISGNLITGNDLGIALWESNNTISENNIIGNSYGIEAAYRSNNKIYHNSLIDNTQRVWTGNTINTWDDGHPSGGNYWSDYTDVDLYSGPFQNATGSDGIWDHPYVIDENNQDRYPLVNPRIPTPAIPPGFLLMASPHSLTIQQGNSDSSVITIRSIGSFDQPVQPTVWGAWPEVTITLNPNLVIPPPGGSVTCILKVTVGITAIPGICCLLVTGTNGTITHSVDISLEITVPEYQPPTCSIQLLKEGVEIGEVDVGEFFDIYVGNSTDDTDIKQVRFSSDDVQDGVPTGQWTEWYDWNTSSGDWEASTKIKWWSFATAGYKEVWAEVKDDIDQTTKCSANIFVPAPALPVITSPLVITPIKDIYWVGDSLTAEFTVKNIGDVAITLDVLTVGGRLNGWCPDEGCPDATHRSVTLQPGESYQYMGSLTLTQTGNYHFFIAYHIENPTEEEKRLLDENNWNTCVQLGEGLTHADRVKNIIVFEEGTVPEEVSQLRDKIDRFKKMHISYPPYLLDVDSFTSAVATLWADFTSFVTRTDLTERYDELYFAGIDYDCLRLKALIDAERSLEMGDVEGAKKYLQKAYTYAKLSPMSFGAAAEVFDGNLESGEILAKGIKDGCDASVKFGLNVINPTAGKAADYIYIGVDYTIDRVLVGEQQAMKNAIIRTAVTYIFDEIKFEYFGGRTIADYTNNRVGKVTFPILQEAFQKNEQLQFALSKIIKETVVELEEKVAEEVATRIVDELSKAINFEQYKAKSPVELRVYNSDGKVTGLISGQVRHEISRSVYWDLTIMIFYPSDSYLCEVAGKNEGTYGLKITFIEDGNTTTFTATEIPTSPNATHQYTVDWDALSQGEEGVTVQVDSDGDGVFEHAFTSDSELTQSEFLAQTAPPPLSVSISPLSASILVGQSVTFTSTVSGGVTPYSYQWHLNGAPVSGATSASWTFTPTTSGIYYVYLKVTDDTGNTTQSETTHITVTTVPVGGYSVPIQLPTTAQPATIHIALLTILTAIFITIKRKTKRKH